MGDAERASRPAGSGIDPGRVRILVTCEHGGNEVPGELAERFRHADEALASHRGWDPGALPLARRLASELDAPLRYATISRLVVDLNRSPHHRRVLSESTRRLPPAERQALLARYHSPYRLEVDRVVAAWLAEGLTVLHLGVHTFTPVLHGKVRRADLALLYDPARARERTLAAGWVAGLKERLPGWAVRRNQPYRGTSDGLTTWLRRRGKDYLGIEVEVNQGRLDGDGRVTEMVGAALVASLPALRSARDSRRSAGGGTEP